MKFFGSALLLLFLPIETAPQKTPPPIIDMHLHARDAPNPPRRLCLPVTLYGVSDPACHDPFLSPPTNEAMVEKTVEIIQRLNTYGVISGYPVERVRRFHRAAPGRLIPAYQLNLGHGTYLSPDVLRHYEYASGHEGDSALAGFAARGRELVVYLAEGAFSEPVKSTLGRQT